jgi:SAM-dependent methyltransferase
MIHLYSISGWGRTERAGANLARLKRHQPARLQEVLTIAAGEAAAKMKTCQCQGIETEFDQREAAKKLADYRKHGPPATTRILIDALREAGIENRTLLDVGGGVGAIQHALLKAGARSAVSVDASTAYVAAAQEEARRQDLSERIEFHRGDFVELAGAIPPADIVTLDRVICCYDDMPALVGLSAARAQRLYALVYPRDAGWVRLGLRLENLFLRLKGSSFRAFVHPTAAVEAILRTHGLRRRFYRHTGVWQVAVYER